MLQSFMSQFLFCCYGRGESLLENVSIFLKFANMNIEIGTKTTPLNKRIFLESLARQLKMAKRH